MIRKKPNKESSNDFKDMEVDLMNNNRQSLGIS